MYATSNTAERPIRLDPRTGEMVHYQIPTDFDSKKIAHDPIERLVPSPSAPLTTKSRRARRDEFKLFYHLLDTPRQTLSLILRVAGILCPLIATQVIS